MKNIMFANSLMLLGLTVLLMVHMEILPVYAAYVSILLLPVAFVMAIYGYSRKD